MEICKTESSNTTNRFMMVEMMITEFSWQVTEFVASHTAVDNAQEALELIQYD